jgi:hypothetical protein
MTTNNSLTWNSLTWNSLTTDTLTASELLTHALTAESLRNNPLISDALMNDVSSQRVMFYIAGCALAPATTLELDLAGGVHQTYQGALGLAPSWGAPGGTCDATCKAWVSACVLARVNFTGSLVHLSMRGDMAALTADPAEQVAYPQREATYYGNIFDGGLLARACLPAGKNSIPRVCGPEHDPFNADPASRGDCLIDVVGRCEQSCDDELSDHSFPNCRDETEVAPGVYPSSARSFPGSVTVFLQ